MVSNSVEYETIACFNFNKLISTEEMHTSILFIIFVYHPCLERVECDKSETRNMSALLSDQVVLGEPRNEMNPLLVKPPLGRPLTRCYTAPYNANGVST